MKQIYLATSWRNLHHARALMALRNAGHDVYDFKNPVPGNTGFAWHNVDLYGDLTAPKLRAALNHPIAKQGFEYNFDAMKWADVCVLVLPSGMSAHLEAGWMAGAGKQVVVYAPEIREPELMYKMFDMDTALDGSAFRTPIYDSLSDVLAFLMDPTP